MITRCRAGPTTGRARPTTDVAYHSPQSAECDVMLGAPLIFVYVYVCIYINNNGRYGLYSSLGNDTSRYNHADVGGELSTIHSFLRTGTPFSHENEKKRHSSMKTKQKAALCGITSGFSGKMCFFLSKKVQKIYCMLLEFERGCCMCGKPCIL